MNEVARAGRGLKDDARGLERGGEGDASPAPQQAFDQFFFRAALGDLAHCFSSFNAPCGWWARRTPPPATLPSAGWPSPILDLGVALGRGCDLVHAGAVDFHGVRHGISVRHADSTSPHRRHRYSFPGDPLFVRLAGTYYVAHVATPRRAEKP